MAMDAEGGGPLRRNKPFRRFKDALAGFPGALDAWYAFKDNAEREWARAWLRDELGITAEDVSQYHLRPMPESW
jgi:hypothetical protein